MNLTKRYTAIITLIINTVICTSWPSNASKLDILKFVLGQVLGSVILTYLVISGWKSWLQAWFNWLVDAIFDLLSFPIYSRYWKTSAPEIKLAAEELRRSELCGPCRKMVLQSKLLCGSRWKYTRLVEWYEYHGNLNDISKSAHHCRLCAMVSSSIKRIDIPTQGQATVTESTPLLASTVSARRLKFKIWEQRPLTKYTYLSVFCNGKPISDRFHITEMPDQAIGPEDTGNEDTTSSKAHIFLAQNWIERCNESHDCLKADASKDKLPKRLVEIKGLKNNRLEDNVTENLVLQLIESATLTSPVFYVAVSYCWGGFEAYKLTSTNYSDSLRSIPVHQVPQILRHALFFAYRLGISHVWIDSMCIVQGDAKDSAGEIDQMHNIYANAYVTIAASCASSSDQSLYRTRDPRSLQPCLILSKYIIRSELADFENSVDLSSMSKRGWIFQERLLSPRTLHFGPEMLYWECSKRSASEIYKDGFTYKSFNMDFHDQLEVVRKQQRQLRATENTARRTVEDFIRECQNLGRIRDDYKILKRELEVRKRQEEEVERQQPAIGNLPSSSTDSQGRSLETRMRLYQQRPWSSDLDNPYTVESGIKSTLDTLRYNRFSKDVTKPNGFHRQWYELVSTYSLGQLTHPEDKMDAFNGITQAVASATKQVPMFGLWQSYLTVNLLWYIPNGGKRPLKFRAPTWSWASLDGPISQGVELAKNRSSGSLGNNQVQVIDTIFSFDENTTRTAASKPTFVTLVLRARTCKVVTVVKFNGALFLVAPWSRYIGRLYVDVLGEDLGQRTDLLCVKMMSLMPYSVDDGDDDEVDIWALWWLCGVYCVVFMADQNIKELAISQPNHFTA